MTTTEMLRESGSRLVDNPYQAAFDLGMRVAEAAFADASRSPSRTLPEWSRLCARAAALAVDLFPEDASDEVRRLVASLARCGARIRWQRLALSMHSANDAPVRVI